MSKPKSQQMQFLWKFPHAVPIYYRSSHRHAIHSSVSQFLSVWPQQSQLRAWCGRGHQRTWNTPWFTLHNMEGLGQRTNCLLQGKLWIYHYTAKANMSPSPPLYKSGCKREKQTCGFVITAILLASFLELCQVSRFQCGNKADINQNSFWQIFWMSCQTYLSTLCVI